VCPTGDRFGVPAGIGEPWYAFAEPGIAWRFFTLVGFWSFCVFCAFCGKLTVVFVRVTAGSVNHLTLPQ